MTLDLAPTVTFKGGTPRDNYHLAVAADDRKLDAWSNDSVLVSTLDRLVAANPIARHARLPRHVLFESGELAVEQRL
jgi:hypothetical protein